jgi:hypothetical protein
MTREQNLALKRERLGRLQNSNKNVKCPGVVKKLKREIRNIELEA